jgi:hypothetical protein
VQAPRATDSQSHPHSVTAPARGYFLRRASASPPDSPQPIIPSVAPVEQANVGGGMTEAGYEADEELSPLCIRSIAEC